ncbi:hypothetical protein GCM10010329_81020 [Streptomyces spiroverticillatus]|uniref:Uncharacterized protein n=1 Tax=Streptomyces finlayi TaxID=67296 RepID=A0A918X740_9ACTN|nr:hypothetical protein GCM10010329_81020 [Streptomyces spiroverticillatus]GHD16401.1 hypothetical protein GCM10010334_77470 [Streptomyces finlayi]
MVRRHITTCPTGKVRYPDKITAKMSMSRAEAAGRGEQRVYRCPQCHGYHLSSSARKP